MITRILYSFIFALFITAYVYAQADLKWARRFNNTSNNDDISVKVLNDVLTGDIYVTGSSYNTLSNYDIVTIKYNSEGIQQWIRTYNGAGNGADFPHDMTFDGSGNIIITGDCTGGGYNPDYVTIKYNPAGNTMWVRTYNGTANAYDFAQSINADRKGAIYITGISTGYSSGEDIVTIKYSPDGTEQWIKRYNGSSNDNDGAYKSAVDSEDNVYITGYCDQSITWDFITIKYSPAGDLRWANIYATRYNDGGYNLLADNSLQQVTAIGKSGTSTMMICYGFDGAQRWKRAADDRILDYTASALDRNGNIYVTGITISAGSYDYLLAAYNSGGTSLWSDIYNGTGSGFDKPTAITADESNNIYLTGQSLNQFNISELTTLKYTDDGSRLWETRYSFPRSQYNVPASIFVNSGNDIFISGYFMSSAGNHDYITVKYIQGTAFTRPANIIPGEFTLYQNYPNPFNPSTIIKYAVPFQTDVKIAVYDILGKEVAVLVNESQSAGIYQVGFNPSALSGGTYFYKITAGDYSEIKKMVFIK